MKVSFDEKENKLSFDFENALILQPIKEYAIYMDNNEKYPVKLELKNCKMCCTRGKYKFVYKLRWIWEVIKFKF